MVRHTQVQKHNILLLIMLSPKGTRVAEWESTCLPPIILQSEDGLSSVTVLTFLVKQSKLKPSGVSLF